MWHVLGPPLFSPPILHINFVIPCVCVAFSLQFVYVINVNYQTKPLCAWYLQCTVWWIFGFFIFIFCVSYSFIFLEFIVIIPYSLLCSCFRLYIYSQCHFLNDIVLTIDNHSGINGRYQGWFSRIIQFILVIPYGLLLWCLKVCV
jgi:hypothetical protein